MNKTSFEAKKEFEEREKEFLKFPSNMGRRIVFMNVKTKYRRNIKKDPKHFWTAMKSLLYDTMRNKSNSMHPNTWELYFQSF